MSSNQLYLFRDRRFLPIFVVQFCGCLNDSIIKSALIILATFKVADGFCLPPHLIILLTNAVFILPFILFASISGEIADKYERHILTRIIKFAELFIILISVYGFYKLNLAVLLTSVCMMGIHSTFFSPIKYSVLPDQLNKKELINANGLFEAGTFISILIGTILGGFYNFNNSLVLLIALSVSLVGLVASFYMRSSNNSNSSIKINLNIISATIEMMRYSYSRKQLYLSILGVSWFWFIGVAILTQIPTLTRDILCANEGVANLFLATFSVGVGVGSFLCSRLYGTQITTRYLFISTIFMSLFFVDLFFLTRIASESYKVSSIKNVREFLSTFIHIRILFSIFGVSVISGLYVVPLFALIQYFTQPAYRSRVISTNNLMNSVFMICSTIFLSGLFYMNLAIPYVILMIAILNTMVAIHVYKLVPKNTIISIECWMVIFKILFKILYRVKVYGLENYKKTPQKTVMIANHPSYIDPLLIATYMPEDIKFAVNMSVAKKWWAKPFLKMKENYLVESNNPMAMKDIIKDVLRGGKVAIFPEGRTSLTGSLMKIYEGPGLIADRAGAGILPVIVNGTQFSLFSKSRKLMMGRFSIRRKITITFLPHVRFDIPREISGKARRKYIGNLIYKIMTNAVFESSNHKKTLFKSLIEASNEYGKNFLINEDLNSRLRYKDIFFKSFILAGLIRSSHSSDKIGIMLPNVANFSSVFFGVHVSGKVPVIINFTQGSGNIISCCNTAQIKTIYTSLKFIKEAALIDLVRSLKEHDIDVIYLEKVRQKVGFGLKLRCFIGAIFPTLYYNSISKQKSSDIAVILFTSGTEALPKAVALSHENLQANRYQLMSRIDFTPHDCAFNTLPQFHCFGLMASLVMTFCGVRTFFYPSPMHYKVIPELVYDVGATIMFGTNTLLFGYAKHAHPYDFYSLRYVISGAEKLASKTRQIWMDKFGIKIFEAYGATECSPCISANTPMYNKSESVGFLLPGIDYFLESVDGLNGYRLYVSGLNIMLGYIDVDKPGVIKSVYSKKLGYGWYDTGDIVSIDEDGYVTIIGRIKRFAKIAGEMISLASVEALANSVCNGENGAMCIDCDDEEREEIVLFSTSKITRQMLLDGCKKLSNLYIPHHIIEIKDLPILANGKTNYVELAKIFESRKSGIVQKS